MTETTTELRIEGMDCAECATHVERALKPLPGVERVETYPMTLRARIRHDPQIAPVEILKEEINKAGYEILTEDPLREGVRGVQLGKHLGFALGAVFALILGLVIVGEASGLLERLRDLVPWWAGALVVLAAGATMFWNVLRSALRRQATSHTLMTLGAFAALAVGEWTAALIVVAFMRIGQWIEAYTTDRARDALRALTRLAPQTAHVVQPDGTERDVPVAMVQPGQVCMVRPGERIPVDGVILSGAATIDQAAITGESTLVEAGPGRHVYAATIAGLGSLRVQAERVGQDSTFGRILRLVEDTEAHRAHVQRFADKFTNYFLPLVVAVAVSTYLVRRDILAAAAVLVVACSCAVALATPVAVLASTGAGAKRGVLVKGGKYMERLAQADTLLVDKTGTLTSGRPRVTTIVATGMIRETEVLAWAASAEQDSEHPLARAIVRAAHEQDVSLMRATGFRSIPGLGVEATVDGLHVKVGTPRFVGAPSAPASTPDGQTTVHVSIDGVQVGSVGFQDTPRPEAKAALARLRAEFGIQRIELLTGDNEATAASTAKDLGIAYRSNLLPEDKIRIVREHQAQGHVVVMVGDGVNDAPALAQADVGIAMGSGTDVAMDAAHVVLMRDDWALVPEAFHRSRRTLAVIRGNLFFTAAFNLVGMALAATGALPLVFAASAQSIPDVGILANSARLLREPTPVVSPGEPRMRALRKPEPEEQDEDDDHAPAPGKVQDVVCKCYVDPATAKHASKHEGRTFHFCAPGCKRDFDADPAQFLRKSAGGSPA